MPQPAQEKGPTTTETVEGPAIHMQKTIQVTSRSIRVTPVRERVSTQPAPASAYPKVFRRLLAAAARDQFIADLRPFNERCIAGFLDRRDMYENIIAPTLRCNEPIAFGRVEPFDSS